MTNQIQEYLYFINNAPGEEQLCQLEMKYMFNQQPEGKLLFSTQEVDPSRSIFFKERLGIMYRAQTFEQLVQQVIEQPMAFESYKILFIKLPDQSVGYRERLKLLNDIGAHIGGEADMYNPKQLLGLTEVNGEWLFGILDPNSNVWCTHENKPYSYSISLSVRNSRAVANIAIGQDFTQRMIDPCCGVGTVVLEALSIGGNIVGNELNFKIYKSAEANLEAFGYSTVMTHGDIQDLEGHYDVAIVDLPYGHFVPIDPDIQLMIMKNARRLADKLVIVTQSIMDAELNEAGFTVVDQCEIKKGKFSRYISVCV
ncbi:MAG TPA: hypothetical protein DCY20_10040 [Firmicutes bacterium]|nr:hypothetical protein [Bacillota bacterium]